jgi:hypothetical protein
VYWILGPTFQRGAGGAAEDRALKVELFKGGLLVTDRTGDRRSFVVKRQLPGKDRAYVVALHPKAEDAIDLDEAVVADEDHLIRFAMVTGEEDAPGSDFGAETHAATRREAARETADFRRRTCTSSDRTWNRCGFRVI